MSKKDQLFCVNSTTFQRMRITIEVDVPENDYDRDAFNTSALTMANTIEHENRGMRLCLVTTQEVEGKS